MAAAVGSEDNLRALEGLMNEFFLPATSNERKKSIEELLNNFSQQKDSWQYCLMFIEQTSNEYVLMYALSVLETLINKQWHGMPTDSKKVIRESIVNYLIKTHTRLPVFLVNKMAKLNVDIARNDWPHFYHDFLSNVLQLMQESPSLGVTFLQMTSEEMANPREDLSITRKLELQQLLLDSMPKILSSLCNVLDGVLQKHRLLLASTPPPSPTGQSISTPEHTGASFQTTNIFQSPAYKPSSSSLMPFDKSSHSLCFQTLTCLGHLFSWIPLSTMITSHLLNTVFSFAAFGCETRRVVSTDCQGQSLGMLAMCCINELLNKNCVPADFESFLLTLFQQTFYLLKKLTKSADNKLSLLDDSFLDKFTEFVRLFVNNHLRRFESNPNFPVLEFLSLLFEYTFKQTSTEEFYSCLNIWQIFIDYIRSKSLERTCKDTSLERYQDGILALVKELLRKMQYNHNMEQLESLDDDSLDDDGMTEMQLFISHCNDTIAPIAELMLDEVSQQIDELFEQNVSVYLKMDAFLSDSSQHSPEVITKVHCCLRDLCTALQTSARMVTYYCGASFEAKFAEAERLTKRLTDIVVYNEKTKLYKSSQVIEAVKKLTPDFIDVYAHALAALKSYTHWIAQYYLESYHKTPAREKCAELITTIVTAILPTVDHLAPGKILEWTVQLIASILTTVRPVYLYDVPCVQELYRKISQGYSSSLPIKVSTMLCNALSSYLILRWPALPDIEQKWDLRSANHVTFINSLHSQFLFLRDVPDLTSLSSTPSQAKSLIISNLTSLRDLILFIQEEPKKTKDLMYTSTKPYIELTLRLFAVFISESDILEKIVDFFLVLLKCLRVQMGVSVTEQTVESFLNLFTKERISEILSEENQTGYRVIESFLKMLELIVQEKHRTFKALLPKIISICMDHVYPLVAPKASPEIKMPLYELIHELLDSNWKYFYESSVIKTFGTVNPSEPLSHQQEFVSILSSYGQSFLQPDISIFKHNLESLEKLNNKWKLYHKTIFLEMMMSQFLNVLLQALVVKSHDLLQDDIIHAIYNMAYVDFGMFYNKFIPAFLKEVGTIDLHQKETLRQNLSPQHKDLPTFASSMQRMVNDLRYYTIVNASLPPGTIDLSQKEPEPISEY
ncbi:exportin-6-like [Watersipora subatra]|uniref:exportin-6-like n=1 Tax=Watersipora subatra TaxID=2589382 RepID=UPI00355C979D